jgi:hypothetical protein
MFFGFVSLDPQTDLRPSGRSETEGGHLQVGRHPQRRLLPQEKKEGRTETIARYI